MNHAGHDYYIYGYAADGLFVEFSFIELTLRPSEVEFYSNLGYRLGHLRSY